MNILIPVALTPPIQVCAPLIKRESTMASINDCCSSAESSFKNIHPSGNFATIHPKSTAEITLTEETLARSMNHCRVCLEESEYSLLSPCKCKSQIHEACLLLWIKHRAEQDVEANQFKCEVCLQDYQLDFNYQRSFSWEALKESYENDSYKLIKLLGTFVLLVSIVIAMGMTLVRVCLEQMEFSEFVEHYHLDRSTLTIILLSGLMGFLLLCVMTGYKLVRDHCLKGQIWQILFQYMENKPLSCQMRQTFTSQSSQCIKFKKIPPNEKQFNILQCKYDLYRKGSPNTYEDRWNALRANNVRSAISVLELPEVENVIEEISRQGSLKENTLNRRDFADFPNFPNNSHRFKQMLSDQRQVKDFIAWFESQYKEVESSSRSPMRKFQDKQTLIASGFNEVLFQISKLSKSRSNILKILWNKENDEVKTIVQELNWHRMQMEKGYLENINSIHSEYQQAIDALKQERKKMIDESQKEKTISSGCINSVRCARKKIIRLESMVKDLTEVNTSLRKENLDLLDENTRFLMNGMDITAEEAILLITRRSKIQQEIARLNIFTKKHFLAALQKQSKNEALPPLQDFEDHKHNLYEYLYAKRKEWPRQKITALDEHFAHDDDSQIQMNAYFKEMMSRASFKNLLLNEHMSKAASCEVGIGTE